MKKMMFVLIILLISVCLYSEDAKETLPIGFIFNISNLLDAPESYQGGIGLKLLTEKVNLRIMADYYFSQESTTSSLSMGLAVEKHFTDKFISPYFGFSAGASYIILENNEDDDNWTKDTIIPIEGGPILGVEVFFTEYLSFFAEYIINFEYSISTSEQSVAGTETSEDDSYFTIDTKMGNNAKLGLTIYLEDQVTMPKRK